MVKLLVFWVVRKAAFRRELMGRQIEVAEGLQALLGVGQDQTFRLVKGNGAEVERDVVWTRELLVLRGIEMGLILRGDWERWLNEELME